jgi:hypothetical protein
MRFPGEDIDDAADREHDDAVVSLLDAKIEGREAGRLNLAAALCPYIASEPQYNAWHEGRMEALAEQLQRRKVA